MTKNAEDQELIDIFRGIDDAGTMRRFFEEIFTPAERRDLALRWKSMRLLQEKIPQREIAQRLGISLCKITRGARILKQPDSVSKKILEEKVGVSS